MTAALTLNAMLTTSGDAVVAAMPAPEAAVKITLLTQYCSFKIFRLMIRLISAKGKEAAHGKTESDARCWSAAV